MALVPSTKEQPTAACDSSSKGSNNLFLFFILFIFYA